MMAENTAPRCECDLCKLGRRLREIVGNLDAADRQVINELYDRMEGAETDLAVSEAKRRGEWPSSTPPKNVREIVAAWLRQNGYDGLCLQSKFCSCFTANLMPCPRYSAECVPGYRIEGIDADGTKVSFIQERKPTTERSE